MKKSVLSAKAGFTLVEMLLVVGVLSLLIGLLSPAILNTMKSAAIRRRANECKVLQAGIMEYWHDQNRWPLPKDTKPKKDDGYKVSYRYDNYKVFDELLEVDFVGTKKDYMAPTEHLSTLDEETKYPAFYVANLKDVLEGNNDANPPVKKRKSPVLVYWGNVISCPKCKGDDPDRFADMNAKECHNDQCPYYLESIASGFPQRYKFKPADRKRTERCLYPFKVEFDLLNNTVKVSE